MNTTSVFLGQQALYRHLVRLPAGHPDNPLPYHETGHPALIP
ncbi:hypothetical protein [Paenibacillus jiagnxiensis]